MENAVVTRNLKYEFNEKELKDKSSQLAQANIRKVQISNEQKQSARQYAAKIASAEAEISLLSEHINSGYDYRPVECEVYNNSPSVGMKEIVRKDTGELVDTVKMDAAELQEQLKFTEAEAKKTQLSLMKGDEPEDEK